MQLVLIAGYYRCQACGRDVSGVRKTRRFWLCDECWAALVAPAYEAEADWQDQGEQWQAMGTFWSWYTDMERRYPLPLHSVNRRAKPERLRVPDDYYPLCECGRPRQVTPFGKPGLFGGPFGRYCDVCDARKSVESIVAMADKIAPARDDEEWLDLLWKSHRAAFDAGGLPDYWYELRRTQTPAGRFTAGEHSRLRAEKEMLDNE